MRFLPAARDELLDAAASYEALEPTLGGRFLDAVDRALELVAAHPEGGALVLLPGLRRPVRQRLVRTFPYLLFYVLDPDPLVVAVAHGRRRPGYWAGRL